MVTHVLVVGIVAAALSPDAGGVDYCRIQCMSPRALDPIAQLLCLSSGLLEKWLLDGWDEGWYTAGKEKTTTVDEWMTMAGERRAGA